MMREPLWMLMVLALATGAEAGTLPDAITSDGFESGNTLGWDETFPPLETPSVFRFNDLDLRDPHVYTTIPGLPVFGCLDFTDDEFPFGLAPSFNQQLFTAIQTDGNQDGLLDLSLFFALRPFLWPAAGRLDEGRGACDSSAPFNCDWARPPVPTTVGYVSQHLGLCLGQIPGTTSGYDPAVPEIDHDCFVGAARTVTLEVGGISVPLVEAQTAANFLRVPPLPILWAEPGLMRGFLTETAANTILIPADIPIVGGRPLSSLLAGGAGSCALGDDRDSHLGQSGWWFYFELKAQAQGFVFIGQ